MFRSSSYERCTGWSGMVYGVFYGTRPEKTNRVFWTELGIPRDVGSVTQLQISLIPPSEPNYNRPL